MIKGRAANVQCLLPGPAPEELAGAGLQGCAPGLCPQFVSPVCVPRLCPQALLSVSVPTLCSQSLFPVSVPTLCPQPCPQALLPVFIPRCFPLVSDCLAAADGWCRGLCLETLPSPQEAQGAFASTSFLHIRGGQNGKNLGSLSP